ncbi:NAD-dependent succinate-semialdehyde dehydrogenase [Gordonia hydrophobica]|uniref:NAD-dependent succinate-semialdehyde dehydrogenase n=1 Tax=Gordonia hydrophobica TaxID=40516 RepID=A0ABZ2U6J3_9ACTN|nr:NAD-dependent succinate-semialdehyde dehydrogenase [Gordonia hydrophobica]MBM7368088.1 succinate-semialdehyde dehydrogenase/glutarate-semialdehyde dehydrogenase [Gordonia hydrophobica]
MDSTPPQQIRPGTFIDGSWRTPTGSDCFAVHDPATGKDLAHVAESTLDEADAALAAAAAVQTSWAMTPSRTRAEVLHRLDALVRERAAEFTALIVAEAGKRVADARAEVSYAADFLRWYAEEAVRLHGRFGDLPEGGATMYVSRRPVGPCLVLTPWNFPLAMITRKLAPALAAGCTAVVKPSEATPLTCFLLTDLLAEAGLPPGVVNVVSTARPAPLSERLLADPALRKVTFTGSTAVGRTLTRQAADRMIRTSMELGGDAPFLVLGDAEVEAAVTGVLHAKFRGSGQACTAANRILVASSVAEEFLGELGARVAAMHSGPGDDPRSSVGPLIDDRALTRTRQRVAAAIDSGFTLLAQGDTADTGGFFHPATLLRRDVRAADPARVGPDVEWFAPVAAVTVYDDEERLITDAADSESGLASYIFSRDLDRARRAANRLEVGMTAINSGLLSNAAVPFGGVKLSGHGREGGSEGIDAYLETHYLLEKMTQPPSPR